MNKLLKLDVAQYGLQESKAKDIEKMYLPMIEMLSNMEAEFNELVSKEVTKTLVVESKALRIRIAKVRINANHARQDAKAEFLRAGNAIQGAYNTLEYAVKSKEEKLMAIEKHFENLEKQRIEQLQGERSLLLQKYTPDMAPGFLGAMDDDVWDNYLVGVKANYNARIEAERIAEEQRIAKEKAEIAERKRIADENIKLKKEAALKEKQRIADEKERQRLAKIQADKLEAEQKERDRTAKIEADKIEKERQAQQVKIDAAKKEAEKLAAQLQAKKDAEIKAENDRMATIEADANKGDSAKVADLKTDLINLKSKYGFKSKKNQKMYADVGILIEKVINHINK